LLFIWLAAAATTSGCSGCAAYRRCSAPPTATLDALPERLSQTGLFAGPGVEHIAADALAYEPAFSLWSDGADKRRWVSLPPGARIDTSTPDAWEFPAGTRFW